GLLAQVIQHEVDHLNGILFVDKVTDPSTFMSSAEYRKRIVNKNRYGVK
ncbi:MAG: peptide deformylase, partial [Patescibacteria group bacterium]